MGLEVEWYDFICFGIVAVAFVGALWILWMQEGAPTGDFNSMYGNRLLVRPEHEVAVRVLPIGHVCSSHLWTSCWRGIHPLCLLATRFLSFLVMAACLSSDVIENDASVLKFYTEYVRFLPIFTLPYFSILVIYIL